MTDIHTYIHTYIHTASYLWPTVCDPMPHANALGNDELCLNRAPSVPWTPVNKTEIGRSDMNTATTLHTTFQVSFQTLHKESSYIQVYSVVSAAQKWKEISHTTWSLTGYNVSTFFTCVRTLRIRITPTWATCSRCLQIDWSTCTSKCQMHFQQIVTLLSMSLDTYKSWKLTLQSK